MNIFNFHSDFLIKFLVQKKVQEEVTYPKYIYSFQIQSNPYNIILNKRFFHLPQLYFFNKVSIFIKHIIFWYPPDLQVSLSLQLLRTAVFTDLHWISA